LYTVSAVVRSGVDLINSMGVVMSVSDAQTLLALPNKAHELVIRGSDPRDADALAKAVSQLQGLGPYEVLSWREAKPELVRIIDMKAYIDVIFLVIVFIAASAGIANTMMMSTFERIHEFGMLLALGTHPRRLVRMILIEAVILGIIGVAVGSALGVGIVWITGQTGIDYAAISGIETDGIAFEGILFSYVIYPQIEIKHILYGLIAVSLTSLFASLWPAALAARLEPAEALRS
jgi:ABC-type lipoprotein release transport system permease subunit